MKLVVPLAATVAAGAVKTLKSAAFAPVKVTPDTFRSKLPVFSIMKVCVAVELITTVPKLVPSAGEGVESPSVTDVGGAPPLRFTSGAGT